VIDQASLASSILFGGVGCCCFGVGYLKLFIVLPALLSCAPQEKGRLIFP
jgi:hypothetical protein